MLIVFLPIFVAGTKVISHHDFIAPLINSVKLNSPRNDSKEG